MQTGMSKSKFPEECFPTTHELSRNSFAKNLDVILTGDLFDHFDVHYSFNAALFVSPIVFPLAFSINTDFQRREKVLDDLANFKSSSMLWFFCMREWKKGGDLDDKWMNQIQKKLKIPAY